MHHHRSHGPHFTCQYHSHFPNPYQYQYRYFYPSPVLPVTAGSGPYNLTHVMGAGISSTAGAGLDSKQRVHFHDSTTTELDNRWSPSGGLAEERLTVRENALKKVLPWRSTPLKDVAKDSSFYTGRDINYNGETDALGTPMENKFRNLVTSSNVLASHANRTYTWNGMKYSPHEWKFNTKQLCSGAEGVHNSVLAMNQEAKSCIDDTCKAQVRCGTDTKTDIQKRLSEVRKWAVKLRKELDYNISQAHQLLELKERLAQLWKNIDQPLEISQENLYTRETRQGVELVHDVVEECLMREIETLRRGEEIVADEMEKVNVQLIRLRAARAELEVDLRNKEEAKNTDECVKLLNELSRDIGMGKIDVPGDLSMHISTSLWLQQTQAILEKSRDERNNSQLLYTEVSRAMLAAADHSFSAWYETNSAFTTRIAEICHAKKELERHLSKLYADIDTIKRHIAEVQKALDEKKPLLLLAQCRLEKRKERPPMELCRDKVMMALLREIHTLKNAVDALTKKIAEMQGVQQELLKTKASLEHDLRLKTAALFVDREKCLCLRQSFPISTFKDTRFPKPGGPVGEEAPMTR